MRVKTTQWSISVDNEVAESVDKLCKTQDIPNRSSLINSLLGKEIERMKSGVNNSWDIRHLQVVLDYAKTVEEVKDLVYTILPCVGIYGWDDTIPVDNDPDSPAAKQASMDRLKDMVKKRLKELREVKK